KLSRRSSEREITAPSRRSLHALLAYNQSIHYADFVACQDSMATRGAAMRSTRQRFLRDAAALGGGVALGTRFVGAAVTEAASYPLIPSAGQTVVAPNLTSSTIGTGTGIIINADNVTIVNPFLKGFQVGIDVQKKADGTWPSNLTIKL